MSSPLAQPFTALRSRFAAVAGRSALRRVALLGAVASTCLAAAPAASAATGPVPVVKAHWTSTTLIPGGEDLLLLEVKNIGDANLGTGFTVSDQLPPGVHATHVEWWAKYFGFAFGGVEVGDLGTCAIEASGERVSCHLNDLDQVLRSTDGAFGFGAPAGEQFGALQLEPDGHIGFPGKIEVKVATDPGATPGTLATNTATVVNPLTIATEKDGGLSSNEVQTVAVRAAAGQYRLTPATALASATLHEYERNVTNVSPTFGAFHVGDVVTGPGILSANGYGAIEQGSEIVKSCAWSGFFFEGMQVSAPGIPPGARILSRAYTPGPSFCPVEWNLKLSAKATETGKRGLIANTTVAAVGSGTIELSSIALEGGTHTLTATETTAPIASNAPASGASSVQAALAALPGVGSSGVSVTGGPGGAAGSAPYSVTFAGPFAGKNLPQMMGASAPTALSGGNASFTDQKPVPIDTTQPGFGLVPGSYYADWFGAAFPFGKPSRQAGDHPFEYRIGFDLNSRENAHLDASSFSSPNDLLRTAEVTLPRGLIGNPQSLPECEPTKFVEEGSYSSGTGCPADTQVGYISVRLAGGPGYIDRSPIYSLKPPYGTPVDLAFQIGGYVQGHIYATLDPAQNYAVKSVSPDISAAIPALSTEVTIWGVPADPAHDRFRIYPERQHTGELDAHGNEIINVAGAPWGSAPIRPFFTNPMDCGFGNGGSRIRVESYSEPGVTTPVQEYGEPDNVEKCEDQRFRFEPKIALQPTDRHAGAPTGLAVHLKDPLRNDEAKEAWKLYAENNEPQGISTPPIKKVVTTFPEGMTLSPSAAQGLVGCTAAQIGIGTDSPVRCPDNSQYGTLTIHTPLLPVNEQPTGFIYITKQNENPFHNFLSLYLAIEEPKNGILIKIPGKLDLNEETGQITVSFDDLPQFPVSDMEMNFKGGVRAGLVEPSTCGEKTIKAEFFSWHEPTKAVTEESHYDITEKPDGSPCVNNLAERQFKPVLQAGTESNRGGAYSPFSFRLTRSDEDQEFSQLRVTLPPGLAAKFAGVGICPDSGVAQALARETVAGDGALEQSDPSCPASSQIGTTMVGAGVGVPLSWVPGKVYLAGPYKGAPMSLVVISPAIVGPYDLGVITVRTALYVNPETAQGEAVSDPFPQIFQGIPVRIRDIRLNLNREGFTLNPTSCETKQIEAKITGTGGNLASTADDTAANLQSRFQASDCASLGFAPSLAFRLYGGTHRGDHPKLKATVKMPRGGANIAKAIVALPRSEFLDQGHIRTVCTRVQFAAHECPKASIYGYAIARTPLFDHPLEGPVYLRSSSHQLPDLVAALKGPASQPVEVDLDGRIDSVNGGIRNSFEVVPDAPVESFKLIMQGGRKGLLVNSQNLCASTNRATADFTAQNGKVSELEPVVNAGCGKAHKKGKGKKRHRPARG